MRALTPAACVVTGFGAAVLNALLPASCVGVTPRSLVELLYALESCLPPMLVPVETGLATAPRAPLLAATVGFLFTEPSSEVVGFGAA